MNIFCKAQINLDTKDWQPRHKAAAKWKRDRDLLRASGLTNCQPFQLHQSELLKAPVFD